MRFLLIFFAASMFLNACSNDNNANVNSSDNNNLQKPADSTPLVAQVKVLDSTTIQPDSSTISRSIKQVHADSKISHNPPFRLLQAFSEQWRSGTRGGGRGTEYYFRIRIEKKGDLQFDTAWISNQSYPVFISKETSTATKGPVTYSRGDTVVVRVSHVESSGKEKSNAIPPIKYNGAGLLIYRFNNNRKFFTIPVIKKQNAPNRS
jgi:hypothetical protein